MPATQKRYILTRVDSQRSMVYDSETKEVDTFSGPQLEAWLDSRCDHGDIDFSGLYAHEKPASDSFRIYEEKN
jgi:hypothetical protein